MLKRFRIFLYGLACCAIVHNTALAEALHFTPIKPASVSCADAQNSVTNELRTKGFFIPFPVFEETPRARTIYPTLKLDDEAIQKYHYGYPQNRTQTLNINLAGESDKLYQGLLSSPVYLSQLAARIMGSCPSIGLVYFNHWWEGGVPVGYFPDGTARTFEYVDLGDKAHTKVLNDRMQYEWGYYFSP